MALVAKYKSARHCVTFEEAYVRIMEGVFDQNSISINVAVYATKDAREREKTLELLKAQYEKVQEEFFLKDAAFKKANVTHSQLSEAVKDLQAKVSSDKKENKELEQLLDKLAVAKSDYDTKLDALHKSGQLMESLKHGVSDEAPVEPIALQKFTFKNDLESVQNVGLYPWLYAKLKDMPEFLEAHDAK